MSSRRRREEPQSSSDSEAVEDDYVEESVPSESEGDGEDLLADGFEADYAPNPELDRYDEDMLDETEYGADARARISAERALNRRDVARGRRLPQAVVSEDEADELADSRRRRRRQERATEGGDDLEMAEEEGEESWNLNNEELKPETDLSQDSRLEAKINKCFLKFLETFEDPQWDAEVPAYLDRIDSMATENSNSLTIRYQPDLMEFAPMLARWVADYPGKILPLLHEQLLQVVQSRYEIYKHPKNRQVFVRLEAFPVRDEIRDLRGNHVNKLINISGVVTKRTSVLPSLRLLFLDCVKCGFLLGPYEFKETSDKIAVKLCPECQHRGPFVLSREETVYKNYQRITVQETPGSVPAGRMPRSKEVVLTGDLVDAVRPGDQVTVIGVYKSKFDSVQNVKAGFPVFKSFIEANAVTRKNDLKLGAIGEEDKAEIEALSKDPLIKQRILASICPSIFGHAHLKTCVALALFGGRAKTVAGRHRIRGDINVLVLGDPGVAKSQALKYVEKLFYRTVYTTGKGASGVGLTASVHRDHISGEYVLEGGALVLADSGICLIDEFDKMNEQDRVSIHEAMEQQTISVSKAGIVASLASRCSVIAAANPLGGRYDPQLSFAENVDLTDPILSRFDCMCVIRDEIDVFKDEQLADFVVCSHMRSHPTDPQDVRPGNRRAPQTGAAGTGTATTAVGERVKPVDQELLRKYLLYARLNCNPVLTEVNQDKLAQFYAEMRKESQSGQGMALTLRQMESMIRMTEAFARMELRDYVVEKDVDAAIACMLEGFISSQKHSVGERLRRKFEAKYIIPVTGGHDLVLYQLKKMFNRKSEMQSLIFGGAQSAEDMQPGEEIVINVDEFRHEVAKLGLDNILSDFLASQPFLDGFELNNGGITRKDIARYQDEE